MRNLKSVEEYKNKSVSHGTLTTQDLLVSFWELIGELKETETEHTQLLTLPFSFIPSYALEDKDSDFWNSEEAQWKLEEMFDLLDSVSPEGFYFGSHPGDGSDFGYWEVDTY
jgi:hypothetical protein